MTTENKRTNQKSGGKETAAQSQTKTQNQTKTHTQNQTEAQAQKQAGGSLKAQGEMKAAAKDKRAENARKRKQKRAEIRAAKQEFKKKRKIRRAELKAAAKRKKISLREERAEAKKANLLKKKRAMQKRKEQKRLALEKKQEQKRLALEKKQEQARRSAQAKRERAETKKQRAKMKQERAVANAAAKKERAVANAAAKKEHAADQQRRLAEKQAEKQMKRARRSASRQERRENKRDFAGSRSSQNKAHGKAGLIAAVVTLGVSLLVLSSAFTVYYFNANKQIAMLNAGYSRAFYGLQGYLDTMDANLSKLAVSSSASLSRSLTTDLAVESELAESSLQELPFPDEAKFHTAKLINQVGDYAKYLQKQLNSGTLSESQRETVLSLQKSTRQLRDKLREISADENGNLKKNVSKLLTKSGGAVKGMAELEESSANLPKLIYDGAFSESTLNRTEARGLKGDSVSRAEAEKIFRTLFADYGLKDVAYAGESTGTAFTCHCFTAMDSEGGEIYAQITAKGGHLALFDRNQSDKSESVSAEDCVQIALAFLEKAGYTDMEGVWTDSFRGECTVNYAANQDGVTMYPDLIKVKVDCADGKVLGLEAYSYLLNHTQRTHLIPRLSQAAAESKVTDTVRVETRRLCVAPLGEGLEELCYEFSGRGQNNEQYYFYISAFTGEEVQIFRVIQGTEGTVLT